MMKTIPQITMVIIIMIVFTGCTSSEPKQDVINTNGNISNETQKEPIKEEEKASEQTSENSSLNDFSLSINDAFITLHSWDNKINLEEILGTPITQNVEELKDADTYTGSFIKSLDYNGLRIELFSPKQNNKTFWIMSMQVSKEGYKTSKGIEVGSTLEEVKNAYPEIEMELDGRTDPNNAAYKISDETKYDYLRFEVKEGLVSEIKIFSQLP
jgi:hypothetical protein